MSSFALAIQCITTKCDWYVVGSEEAEEDSKDGSSGVLHFCSTLLYKSRCQEILDQVHPGAIFRRNASGWSVAYFQLNMSSLSTYLAACFGESARPYPEGFLGSIWLRDGLEPQNLEKKMPEKLQCHSESECLRFGHFCQCYSVEASAVGMKLFGCQNLSPGRMGVQADLAAASLDFTLALASSKVAFHTAVDHILRDCQSAFLWQIRIGHQWVLT